MEIRSTIDIAAPSHHVWRAMSDVERWPDWTPTVSRLELLDGGPLRIGSRARIRQPRLPVAVWTVTALEEGRSFEWRNASPGLRSVATHTVESQGNDGSRVTLTLDWSGPITPFLRLIYGRLARNYVATEAAGLKRWCESGATGGEP